MGNEHIFQECGKINKNEYAYLEPLAAVPEYRRMGLGTAALPEGMKNKNNGRKI
jgi:hypothetical protein